MSIAAPPNIWPIHHPLKWTPLQTISGWIAWSLLTRQVDNGVTRCKYVVDWKWPRNRNTPFQLGGDAVRPGEERQEFHRTAIEAKREAQRIENLYLDWYLSQAAASMGLTDGQLIAAIKTKNMPEGKTCCLICGRQPFVAGPGGCVFQRYGLCTKCFKKGVRA